MRESEREREKQAVVCMISFADAPVLVLLVRACMRACVRACVCVYVCVCVCVCVSTDV